MGTYYIPRNYKGETRILYIFTVKSLITTAVGAGIGSIFLFVLNSMNLQTAGLIAMGFFALLGFLFGAVKIPTIVGIPITKKIGGEPFTEICSRYIKYRQSRSVYTFVDEKKEANK